MSDDLVDHSGFVLFPQINDLYHIDFRADPTDDSSLILPSVATVIKRLKDSYPGRVLFCLPGDFLNPACLSRVHRSAQIVDVLNHMGLDLASFGNHEFDFDAERHFTPEDLIRRIDQSAFKWLVSNLDAKGSAGDQLAARRDRVTDCAVIPIAPGHTVFVFGFLYASNYTDVGTFTDPIERCRRLIDLAKREMAERTGSFKPARATFVAMTHQDLRDDVQFARECPGLHLIMGGHDHEVMRKLPDYSVLGIEPGRAPMMKEAEMSADMQRCLLVKAKSNSRTLRLNVVAWMPKRAADEASASFGSFANAFNRALGDTIIRPIENIALTGRPDGAITVHRGDPDVRAYLDMRTAAGWDAPGVMAHKYDNDGASIVVSIFLDTVHPGFRKLAPPDPATLERIRQWVASSPEHSETLIQSPVDIEASDEASRARSTNFGNFVADIVRKAAAVDPTTAPVVGLVNGGSFRLDRDIQKGEPITRAVVCDLLFHDNDVRRYMVTGAVLEAILRRSLEKRDGGHFLQVAGLEIEARGGAIERIMTVDEAGARRPLDPTQEYVVGTTSYVATDDRAYGSFFRRSGCHLLGVPEPSIRQVVEREIRRWSAAVALDAAARWRFLG